MALPHPNITQIPDNEPDAVPALWNVRYDEIDENFANLQTRLANKEAEVENARGENNSLKDRLDTMEGDISGLSPDMQNALMGLATKAMSEAGLANRELDRLTSVRMQEGEITIKNRGVVSGCSVSKSTTATRNLDLSAGKCFAHGRTYGVAALSATAAVPSNTGASAATCRAYLYLANDGTIQCDCTELGGAVPDNGIEVALLTVPSGSTEATAPYLDGVTITDTRRLEPQWPILCQNPAFAPVALANTLPDALYGVQLEVVSCEGGREQIGEVTVSERLKNGFKLVLGGAADAVNIRYMVTRLGA